MTTTVFTDFVTPVPAAWLNDTNAVVYTTVPSNTAAISAEQSRALAAEALLAPLTNAVLVTPNLGTPSAGVITNTTGSPALVGTNFTGTAGALSIGGNAATATTATTATNATNLLNTAPTKIPTITATVAASALTIGASAQYIDFRAAALTSGTITTINAAPANLVVPSTATLGTINGITSRLVVLEIINAGVAELAVVNIAGGNNLDETTLISTTAISASATANNVIYSTTARTSVPFRVIGYVESTQATSGIWATAPSTIQGAGGNALAAMSSLGYGQTWQNMTGSRAYATTYYNTTGRPIIFSVNIIQTVGSNITTANNLVNGLVVVAVQVQGTATGGESFNLSALVPPGASYSIPTPTGAGGGALGSWFELR